MRSFFKFVLLSSLLVGSDALFQPIVLDNVLNLRYTTNITVNDRQFKVLIDTGSSDLFLRTSENFQFSDTGISITDSYGGGQVPGTIGFATVKVGGYTSSNQVFNNATSIGLGEVTNLGLDGLIGLSFDMDSNSPLKATLKSNHENDTLGEPFLFNIFNLTPQQDNFITISLSRTNDLEGSADTSFGINDLDLRYLDVVTEPEIPLFPGTNGRFSVLVDSMSVDNVSIALPTSTVSHTPPGKNVALLDTGTPSTNLPAALFHAIYSAIPGSTQTKSTWIIPCNTTSILTVNMGGQAFPIHPLDLSNVQTDKSSNATICVAAIEAVDGNSEFDAIFGDLILRNMYQLYNFGDSVSRSPTGNASVQLLSQTDPKAAIADVLNVRMALISGQSPSAVGAAVVAAAAGGTDSSDTDSQRHKYALIVIGLLGANVLVTVIVAVIGVVLCMKKRGGSRSREYAPLQLGRGGPEPLDGGYDDKRYSE
ncbi:aspartic peptidase domain-containing protein [Mycena vitilis]|nr:aspartic peptidase domain-containing protein [Mycena vitilis]